MLCERCGKNIATVHVTHINNGEKVEMYLCNQCAKETEEINFDSPISFQNFLTGLLGMPFGSAGQFKNYNSRNKILQCPTCKMTYDEFRNLGRFGCADCYFAFREQLNPIFKKIHGDDIHTGKLPNKAAGELKIKKELQNLKKELQKAIKMEEFERAAYIRDKIRALEGRQDK
ncbi:UvrB/UvrC motif-containing protein [Defluviitalea phaphyphila]|uniref:UvrB/UvrC motif-containing protein n=1 Tax=Defluviitalea phaphyphila TaxID=1473580 RepID=UPI000730FB3A|nr:UvrB/UvrC motif-containing protein [Defluviitalea phaphyphila]